MAGLAFASVDNKLNLDRFADEVTAGGGMQIIAGGGTADAIQECGIDVIPPEMTASNVIQAGAERYRALGEEVGARELIGSELAKAMSWTPERLARVAKKPIDLVYINLRAPKPTHDEDGNATGVNLDKGGMYLLQAAMEGGRRILCEPGQIDYIDDYLTAGLSPTEEAKMRRELISHAFRYLYAYATRAQALIEV